MKPAVLFLSIAALVPTAMVLALPAGAQSNSVEQPDKYTWLEDIHGARSMDWVKAEDARTAAVLEKDPRFATLGAEALSVLESPDRLASPQFRSGQVYNVWRDASHLRGIVRRTTLESYLTADPNWETVLDYDALSKADKQSWVGKGADCLQPEDELCLVQLSAGGEDAVTMREMDLKSAKFVDDGFTLPRGKQRAAWLDKDTLLIGRDWGPGTMSEAGYPITVREWKRGAPTGEREGDLSRQHQGQRLRRRCFGLSRWPRPSRCGDRAQPDHVHARDSPPAALGNQEAGASAEIRCCRPG